jgi:hypothetical protein
MMKFVYDGCYEIISGQLWQDLQKLCRAAGQLRDLLFRMEQTGELTEQMRALSHYDFNPIPDFGKLRFQSRDTDFRRPPLVWKTSVSDPVQEQLRELLAVHGILEGLMGDVVTAMIPESYATQRKLLLTYGKLDKISECVPMSRALLVSDFHTYGAGLFDLGSELDERCEEMWSLYRALNFVSGLKVGDDFRTLLMEEHLEQIFANGAMLMWAEVQEFQNRVQSQHERLLKVKQEMLQGLQGHYKPAVERARE